MHEPIKSITVKGISHDLSGEHNDLLRPTEESPAAEYTDKNLQIYLTAPPDDFAALCRKFTAAYFPRGMVLDFTMHNDECVDILASVYPKGRSRAASPSAAHPAGSYSKKARDYTTGMRLDLFEQQELLAVLTIEKMREVDCWNKAMTLFGRNKEDEHEILLQRFARLL